MLISSCILINILAPPLSGLLMHLSLQRRNCRFVWIDVGHWLYVRSSISNFVMGPDHSDPAHGFTVSS